jgi:hypothetical protein
MEPNIWGKHAWIFLHSVSMNYPDNPTNDDRKNYKNFFENLRFILPCEVCKKHYSKHIQSKPIEHSLHSKKKLVEWVIEVHNQVNISLNKPTMSYDQVIDLYKKIYNNSTYSDKIKINLDNNENILMNNSNLNTDNTSNNYLENNIIIIIIITIAILLFILWKNI